MEASTQPNIIGGLYEMCSNIFNQTDPIRQGNALIRERIALFDRGYSPVPVNGKNPSPIVGWNTGEITPDRIRHDVVAWPSHTNTGLLSTTMPVVDIDLWDDDHVAEIGIVVDDRIGLSPLVRRGRKGLALFYRLIGEPISKQMVREKTDQVNEHGRAKYKNLVEILGSGNQSVAYGIHPEIQRPYEWVGDSEPLSTPYADLPGVTADQLRDLAAAIRERCAELGYDTGAIDVSGGTSVQTFQPAASWNDADRITQRFLDLIGGGKTARTGFINMTCPGCGRKGKGGFKPVADGGFRFYCFRASCEYSDATGWSPGRPVGDREKRLYQQLGGSPDDLWVPPRQWQGQNERMSEVLAQLRAERAQTRAVQEGK